MSTETQTLIIVVTNLIVGVGLAVYIKFQNKMIKRYQELVAASNPDNIIKLHDQEVQLLKNITSPNINDLQTQVHELANFAVHGIFMFEENNKTLDYLGKPQTFNKIAWINLNFPHCSAIIQELYQIRLEEGR
jgi:hypothetical protein